MMSRYDELPFTYPRGFVENDGVLMAESVVCQGAVDDAVLGPDCKVGEGAKISASLLMKGCQVGQGAQVVHSVLGVGVVVPSNCIVENCVIGDGVVLDSGRQYVGEKVEHFS